MRVDLKDQHQHDYDRDHVQDNDRDPDDPIASNYQRMHHVARV